MLEEIEILISQSGFSKGDLDKTPVYQRHAFINILRKRREKEQEDMAKNNGAKEVK